MWTEVWRDEVSFHNVCNVLSVALRGVHRCMQKRSRYTETFTPINPVLFSQLFCLIQMLTIKILEDTV